MQFSRKLLRWKSKKKIWAWRPMLFFTLIGFFIFLTIGKCIFTNEQLNELRAGTPLTKVEMKIGSDSPPTFVTISDLLQLDSINHAFQTMQKKNIPNGGEFETWAELKVYKGSKKISFFIQYSDYNGWMVDLGGVTLRSDYLFRLVKRYAKKK